MTEHYRSDTVHHIEGGSPARVTVIVTIYNYAKYIEETLQSVFDSTMQDIALVIVDDHSTDGSLDVVLPWFRKHACRFCECIVLRNRENYGLAYSRNLALKHVRAEFFFVLDADNAIYPTALSKLHEACLHTRSAAAYSQLECFDAEEDLGHADIWDPRAFETGNYVDAMAMIRMSACLAVGGYGYFEVPGYEDYDLWCKFIEHGYEAVFVPQILCRYRVHPASMLRTETTPSIDVVAAEMISRHPWLKLDRLTAIT